MCEMQQALEEAYQHHVIADFAVLLESLPPEMVMTKLMDIISDDAGDKLSRVMRKW